MKVRRLIILTLILSLFGASMVFADTASTKIRVFVNGEETEDGGYLIDGKAYLPVGQLSTLIQGLVSWDNTDKKVTIQKPNVHMILFQEKSIFQNVTVGKYTFNVFCQIDNLRSDISSVKVTIVDPFGKSTDIQEQNVTEQKESFWFKTQDLKYDFKMTGKYTVKFFIKPAKSDDYQLVSEKVIVSRED